MGIPKYGVEAGLLDFCGRDSERQQPDLAPRSTNNVAELSASLNPMLNDDGLTLTDGSPFASLARARDDAILHHQLAETKTTEVKARLVLSTSGPENKLDTRASGNMSR
ncbi:hypothetical protein BJX61DRAFT_546962 [Aspergillus egyptiacus]|nr:hypothetical protein BJX61DRAFT_546962 [Aspergillus egyptiacus]